MQKFIIVLALLIVTGGFCKNCFAEQFGKASWYSFESARREGTSGYLTASGQTFDENELTCASWDHAFGTKLKVTNIKNGKSVIVTVTDRGPNKKLYRRGRIIDLSKASFAKIAKLSSGIIKVKIEVVDG